MATARKRGSGWEVRYYSGGARRSMMVPRKYTRKQAEAMGELKAASTGNRSGQKTLGDAVAFWVSRGARRSQLSQETVERRCRLHISPRPIAKVALDDLTVEMLEDFYRELADEGMAPLSVRAVHWCVSGACKTAVRRGWLASSPAAMVEWPQPATQREVVPPTPGEVAEVLDWLDAQPSLARRELALAIRIAVATGARVGEICALCWGDVHFAGAVITLARSVSPVARGRLVKETKTGVVRHQAVPPTVIARLADHRAFLREQGIEAADADWVFLGGQVNGSEQPIHPSTLSQRWVNLRPRFGQSWRFHDLRHLTVSIWLASMPIADVTHAIGHRHTSTTTDTYGHRVSPQAVDRRAAEAIEAVIQL